MKNDSNNQLSLKGYQATETLYQGTKTEVDRDRRLADRQAVVIVSVISNAYDLAKSRV
ncbi:MAG: hypothetical protein P2A85_02995 [Microcoleus anatoxicus]|uniref:hypothetical protein n=1 Tax=Microcoleus anatoxicus TaxID=2705319 RepID=UPI003672BA70